MRVSRVSKNDSDGIRHPQLIMCPNLCNTSVLDEESTPALVCINLGRSAKNIIHSVCILDRGQAMGDRDSRSPHRCGIKCLYLNLARA